MVKQPDTDAGSGGEVIGAMPRGRWIDISVPIRPDMPLWPGEHNRLEHAYAKRIDRGDPVNVSRMAFGLHTGTHVDAPFHHVADGGTMESVDLDRLIGPAVVHDLTHVREAIAPDDLARLDLAAAPICLFKTRNSQLLADNAFTDDYVYITPEAAEVIVQCGVDVVAIDYLSVEQFSAPVARTHQILLGAGTLIIESVNLAEVAPGPYTLVCLPLNIPGAEAAPARAVLVER